MRKVKARSTILKERQRVCRIIASRPIPASLQDKVLSEAYGMEAALLWVLEDCGWTPSGLLQEKM